MRSPLTFFWTEVPKQCTNTAPSSWSECHLTVFCIDEIVPGYVVYLVNSWNSTTEFIQTLRANTFGNLMTIVWWWSTWHPRELVPIGCNVPKKSSEIPLRIMITIPTWARLLQNSALAKKQLGFYSFSVLLWTLFFNGF